MKEKIYIENFLGIKKIDLKLNKINILIGQQSIGKSVCSKLLFFFKSLIAAEIKPKDVFTKSEFRKKVYCDVVINKINEILKPVTN